MEILFPISGKKDLTCLYGFSSQTFAKIKLNLQRVSFLSSSIEALRKKNFFPDFVTSAQHINFSAFLAPLIKSTWPLNVILFPPALKYAMPVVMSVKIE